MVNLRLAWPLIQLTKAARRIYRAVRSSLSDNDGAKNILTWRRTTRHFLLACGFFLLPQAGCAAAELYRSAEKQFQTEEIGALDSFDQQWIENENNKLNDSKAVNIYSMKLSAKNSVRESGLEVQYFEDSECKGMFCRMVIKCGPSTDTRRFNLALMARKDISIAAWNFEPDVFDVCVRQAIRVSTPSGPLVVVVGRFGFEIGDPNSSPPHCWDRITF